MANNISGRQFVIDSVGLLNFPANIKIVDCWWQDVTAAGQTFSFTDVAGRAFTFTSFSTEPLRIGKLDWLEGPLTVTAIGSGKVYMIIGK